MRVSTGDNLFVPTLGFFGREGQGVRMVDNVNATNTIIARGMDGSSADAQALDLSWRDKLLFLLLRSNNFLGGFPGSLGRVFLLFLFFCLAW